MASSINASTSSGVTTTADTSGILQFQTASVTALTIDASQNVGIGTASPAYKLDISGQVRANAGSAASALIANSTNAGGTALNVQNSGTVNMLVGGYNAITGSGNATDVMLSATQGVLAFGTGASSTERMRISSSGGVSIGNTTDAGASNLSVTGSVTTASVITTKGSTSVPNSTATTIFSIPTSIGRTFYQIAANLLDAAGSNSYIVIVGDRTNLRIAVTGNDSSLLISLSGRNVQVTQTYGSTQTIAWGYTASQFA
jgi:hypothetical protein